MKAIKIYEQDGNRTVGIFKGDGGFTALTFSQSKSFKTLKAAEKWLAKFL
jgi:hypothetical protein